MTLGGNVVLAGTAINLAKTVDADVSINNRTLTINGSALTTLGGAVGGTAPLSQLVTDSAGTLTIGTATTGGTITASTITLGDTATLAINTTLTGATINLKAITGATFDLTVSGTDVTTLDGAIATVRDLKLDNGGSTTISTSGSISVSGKQTYNDPVTLAVATTTTSTGGGQIAFNSTINGAFALVVASGAGATTFGGAVNIASLQTTGTGTLTVSGGSVTTTTTQDYAAATLVLGANTTLTGTTPSFNTTTAVNGAGYDLTLNFSSNHTIDGTKFDDGAAAGSATIRHLTTGGTGNTDLTGLVVVSGRMTFNDVVTQSGNTTLQASDVTFNANLTGPNTLTINATGLTTIGDAVGDSVSGITTLTIGSGGSTIINAGSVTVATQDYSADVVVLGQNTTLTAGTALTLKNIAGNGKNLTLGAGTAKTIAAGASISGIADLTVTGVITVNGGTISTSGLQSYSGAITLATGSETFTSTGGGNITFAAIDGAFGLTVNTSGTTTFGGTVGTTITTLTTDAGGGTSINVAGVTTTGNINFNDPVTLGAATVTVTSGGTVNFASTVDSSAGTDRNLVVDAAATTTFGGAVGLGDTLGTLESKGGGTTAINGGTVATATTQDYDAETDVTLGQNTTLSGTSLIIAAVPIKGNDSRDLTLNFSTAVTIVDATFANDATGNLRIRNLSYPSGAGAISITGETETTGTQSYSGPITLAGGTTLVSTGAGSSGDITFGNSVGGGQALTVTTAGTTTINGIVGGLASLSATGGGAVVITQNITTSGAQSYSGPVTITGTRTLTTTNSAVTFSSTLNGASVLAIARGTGPLTFTGAVGGVTPLTSIATTGDGNISVAGGQITTSGNQNYGGAGEIQLGANTTLTGGTPTFPTSGVDGSTGAPDYELTLNFSGLTTVGANFTALSKLTTGGTGTTDIAGSITLTAPAVMTFNDAVTTTAAATLTATDITFASTVAPAEALTLTASGTATLASTLTSSSDAFLSTAGTTVLGGNVNTGTAAQTYTGSIVRLAADLTMTSTDATGVTLGAAQGTGDGTEGLTVAGNAVVGAGGVGTVAGKRLQYLVVNGTTSLNANVTTAEHQTYTGAITLATTDSNPVLTGTTPTFTAGVTTGNASNLTLDFSGTTAIVGGATFSGVEQLTTGNGGTTTITGALTTTGAMTFHDAVQLVGNTTLDSGATAIAFNSTLNSDATGGRTLTIPATGTKTFAGAVGGIVPLGTLNISGAGGITISGGSVDTTGAAQTYTGAVTLGADATLTGTVPTFSAGVVGNGKSLTLNFSGATTLAANFGGGAIKNLATGNGGGTTIGGDISTTGTQTYNDAVTISANSILASSGSGNAGNITFNSTINGAANNAQSLAVNTGGTTTFNGSIGLGANGIFEGTGGADDKELSSLTTDAVGGTTIGGGTIFATTANFSDTVTLTLGAVLKGTTTGFLNAGTAILGGGNSLTLSGTGVTTIAGNVSNLSSLTRDAGTTTFGTTAALSITTTGSQFYSGALTVVQNTTLTGSSVTSATTTIPITGPPSLTVNIVP